MKITFLSGDRRLTKSITIRDDGTYEHTPYPLVTEVTSHEHEVNSLEDLLVHLTAHGQFGHCLLKGNLQRPIVRESRKGLVSPEPTELLVLDLDGLDTKGRSIDAILGLLGLGDVDYILQYSARQGIKEGLNAHIFMLLDRPVAAEILKQWLQWKNLTIPFFKEQICLTRNYNALRWKLDVTVCQNDKLIYIAPPDISGGNNPCPQRMHLELRGRRKAMLDTPPHDIGALGEQVLVGLRMEAGLPSKPQKFIFDKKTDTEYLKDPTKSAITGIKRHGTFTYLNLNGGDSWGYYHLTEKPEYLYNFKGEPTYRLRDICPEYYKDALDFSRVMKADAHKPRKFNGERARLVINNREEGRYYKVDYDPDTGVVLSPAPSEKHIIDWCTLNKVAIPEHIPDWDVRFDPTTMTLLDSDKNIINTHIPTKYKKIAKHPDRRKIQVPLLSQMLQGRHDSSKHPAIEYFKLIYHVCGSDFEASERLLNWIAFVWQTGRKPRTAWVLHGTYRTGKGRLGQVLKHLFGIHFVERTAESVSEQFNAGLEYAQFLWIDEVTTDAWDNAKMTPKLRNWITEGRIAIRKMRTDVTERPNFMGIIIAANERNPVEIRFRDPRFNVAPRQEVRLEDTDWFSDEIFNDDTGLLYIEDSLIDFASYLEDYPVDVYLATHSLENEAKRSVMKVTQNLPEDIVQAIDAGNTSFFLDFVHQAVPGNPANADTMSYETIVAKMMKGGFVPLRTAEIRTIFTFLAGWTQARGKFNKAVAKFGLELEGKKVRDGNNTYSGIGREFVVTEKDREFWDSLHLDKTLTVVNSKTA